MFDPARCGEMLRELLLINVYDLHSTVKDDGAAGCRALINGKNVGHGAAPLERILCGCCRVAGGSGQGIGFNPFYRDLPYNGRRTYEVVVKIAQDSLIDASV